MDMERFEGLSGGRELRYSNMLLQGKRSASDHINEAVNHINQMKDKIQQLTLERDRLESTSNPKSASSTRQIPSPKSGSNSDNSFRNSVVIRPCFSGMEIVISGGLREEDLPLSRVLEVLVVEGLNIVKCASTKVRGRFVHTIQAEVRTSKMYVTLSFIKLLAISS